MDNVRGLVGNGIRFPDLVGFGRHISQVCSEGFDGTLLGAYFGFFISFPKAYAWSEFGII